jgi:hypothetical protein
VENASELLISSTQVVSAEAEPTTPRQIATAMSNAPMTTLISSSFLDFPSGQERTARDLHNRTDQSKRKRRKPLRSLESEGKWE